METVPNVEKSSLMGKGTLLVSCPRNRTGFVCGNYAWPEGQDME
jgi:hypothetical protein